MNVRSTTMAVLVASALWIVAAAAEAQIRVTAFPSTVTASGPPMTVWVTVHNDGDQPAQLFVGRAEERTERGTFAALEVSGFEIDGARSPGPTFVVGPHASVRLVVFVGGFSGERHRGGYDARVTVCPLGGPATSCVSGETRVSRAYRDPIPH